MKRRFGKVLGLSAVGVALLVAVWLVILGGARPAWGQAAAAPTTRPAKLPEAVRKVMANAPIGACGVVHFDVAAMRPALLKILNTNKDLAEEFEFDTKAAAALIAKTEAADVFICIRRRSMEPVLVLRGKAGLTDLLAVPKGDPLQPTPAGNGRYDLGKMGSDPRFIVGAEAKDLAKGLLIVGRRKVVTDDVVAKLGESPDPKLQQLLAKVDRSCAIWVAVSLEELSPRGAPKHILGGIDTTGKTPSEITAVFSEDKHAERAMADLQEHKDMLGGILVAKTKGAGLTLSLPKGPQALDRILTSAVEIRRGAKRSMSTVYVRVICIAARMFETAKGGPAPSLLALVEEGSIPTKCLTSPVSGRKLKTDEKGNPVGPFDYIYVVVSTQDKAGLPRARRVLIYERPENYKNKGTVVGYADGRAEWVKMAKFKEDLQATQTWLAEQAK